MLWRHEYMFPGCDSLGCQRFVREDFPEIDNKNWLKWIIIQDKNGQMDISTEDIPIARYPIKP
jgi:hypothetical protein